MKNFIKHFTTTPAMFTCKLLWQLANLNASKTDLPIAGLYTSAFLISVPGDMATNILKLVKERQ